MTHCTPKAVDDLRSERLLSPMAFAALLGVSIRKSFEILASGSIRVVTLGKRCRRVTMADALAWIEARRK